MGEVGSEIPNSEILNKVSAERQPSNTEKPKELPSDAELNSKKKQQKHLDNDKTKLLKEEVASLTQTTDKKPVESKSEDNKELPVNERIKREEKKFLDTFYGERITLKLAEIEKKAWRRSTQGDSLENELKALEDINTQVDKYVPEKFHKKLEEQDPEKDIEDQGIPSYMLTIDESGNATYNPFNKPPFRLELQTIANKIDSAIPRKPGNAVLKELRDYYTKAKVAEAAEQKKPM